MYDGDSFFTLSPWGQVGLAVLSGVLAIATLWLTWRVARGRRLGWRLCVWVLGFVGFVWLSPQIYYLYYRTLIDGLPMQVVVAALPEPERLLDVVLLRKHTLSIHGQAVLCLLMLLAALLGGLDRVRRPTHQEGENSARREP